MTVLPNSIERRDIASQLHPNVNLRTYEREGGVVIASGDGIYVTDNTGKRHIEALAGLWSVALGFNEKRLLKAAMERMEKLPYDHTFNDETQTLSVELAELLLTLTPVPMSKVHFAWSGWEANDLAVKIVWYRSNARGKPEKKKIIGRHKGYHGVTVASGSLTGLHHNHESFDLPLDRMIHTSCPSDVHFARDGESEAEFTVRMVQDLADLAKHPLALSSRGVGLIGALEVNPFADGKPGEAAAALQLACEDEGGILRNIGQAIVFCPPMIITAEQIDDLFDALGRALERVAAQRAKVGAVA